MCQSEGEFRDHSLDGVSSETTYRMSSTCSVPVDGLQEGDSVSYGQDVRRIQCLLEERLDAIVLFPSARGEAQLLRLHRCEECREKGMGSIRDVQQSLSDMMLEFR